MLPVMTGRHTFGCSLQQRAIDLGVQVKARLGMDLLPMTAVSGKAALVARVNHNRWIVDCPDCNSAEYVWPDEPLFMCTNCFNGTAGGKWRRVRLPAERQTIERILMARPVPQNRNWTADETPKALREENEAHGLPQEVMR